MEFITIKQAQKNRDKALDEIFNKLEPEAIKELEDISTQINEDSSKGYSSCNISFNYKNPAYTTITGYLRHKGYKLTEHPTTINLLQTPVNYTPDRELVISW